MTLVVTVRVPDAVVMAADGLSTISNQVLAKANLSGKCPKCNTDVRYDQVTMPPLPVPAGGSEHARKLFSLSRAGREVAVACFGSSFIAEKTILRHIWDFESREMTGQESVAELAEKLGRHFLNSLSASNEIKGAPKDVFPFGFQMAGYNNANDLMPATFSVQVGHELKIEETSSSGYGATVNGEAQVVQMLWNPNQGIPVARPLFQFLNVQDAIDYALFLVETTIGYQRFAAMVPTVGGEADVAVLMPYNGLRWVQRKQLTGHDCRRQADESILPLRLRSASECPPRVSAIKIGNGGTG